MSSSLPDRFKDLQLDAKGTDTLCYRLAPNADKLPLSGCDHEMEYDTPEKRLGAAIRNVICFIGSGGSEGKTHEEVVQAFEDRSFLEGKQGPLFTRTIALFDYILANLSDILYLVTQGEVVETFRKEKKDALSKT